MRFFSLILTCSPSGELLLNSRDKPGISQEVTRHHQGPDLLHVEPTSEMKIFLSSVAKSHTDLC